MKTVLIYNDRGVSPESYRETWKMCLRLATKKDWIIKTVSADIINHEPWESEANLLIIPGGRETPYSEDLQEKGGQRIKDFVAAGGSYLGICAGAYYAASRIIFEKGHPEHEIITERSLGLYSGEAEGPAYGLGKFQYQSEEGARTALIKRSDAKDLTIPTYFNGGCWFHSHQEDNNTQIIARYADIENEPAAIISCQYGKGRVCLSGVHFEYDLKDNQQNLRDTFIEHLQIF